MVCVCVCVYIWCNAIQQIPTILPAFFIRLKIVFCNKKLNFNCHLVSSFQIKQILYETIEKITSFNCCTPAATNINWILTSTFFPAFFQAGSGGRVVACVAIGTHTTNYKNVELLFEVYQISKKISQY